MILLINKFVVYYAKFNLLKKGFKLIYLKYFNWKLKKFNFKNFLIITIKKKIKNMILKNLNIF